MTTLKRRNKQIVTASGEKINGFYIGDTLYRIAGNKAVPHYGNGKTYNARVVGFDAHGYTNYVIEVN